MGAQSDALAAVDTALGAAGVATVIKGRSNVAPPTAEHAVLAVDPSPLERADVDNYDGTVAVTIDWFTPGASTDGQTEYLAALDDYDAIIVSLTSTLDRTCISIAPEPMDQNPKSDDLEYWYSGTIVCTFMRKEPASP